MHAIDACSWYILILGHTSSPMLTYPGLTLPCPFQMAAADSFYTQDLPNFPAAAQEHCLTVIRHLQSLKFEVGQRSALSLFYTLCTPINKSVFIHVCNVSLQPPSRRICRTTTSWTGPSKDALRRRLVAFTNPTNPTRAISQL